MRGPATALLTGTSEGPNEADIQKRTVHELAGLELLCDHYGISWAKAADERFLELSLHLARAHVPFFRERKPKARRWGVSEQIRLIIDVAQAQETSRLGRKSIAGRPGSVKSACHILVRQPRYKRIGVTSLEARYKEAISQGLFGKVRDRVGIQALQLALTESFGAGSETK